MRVASSWWHPHADSKRDLPVVDGRWAMGDYQAEERATEVVWRRPTTTGGSGIEAQGLLFKSLFVGPLAYNVLAHG